MTSDFDLARAIFGQQVQTAQAPSATAASRIEGDARSDSSDGKVLVALRGDTVSGDGNQAVEMPTSVAVKQGQVVVVTVTGNKPMVTDVVGWGDAISEDVSHIGQDAADAAAGVQEAKDAAQAAKDAADEAKATADGYQQQITEVTTKVGGIEADVSELSAEVSGAVEDAAGALSAATKAQQDIDGFRTTVEQTYQPKGDYATSADLQSYATKSEVEQTAGELSASVAAVTETAEGALSQASQAKQTADEVSQTLSTDYVSKADASKTYASKAELSATSSSLSASIEEVATTADAAQADLDAYKGTVSSTYATKSSVEQTADSITAEVAKTYQTKDGMSSYATKSYVDQQDDSITSTVSEVSKTADSAMEKASTVEQTASGLTVRLTQTERDVETAQSTASAASSNASTALSTANTAKTTATTAQSTANTAKSTADSAKSTATTANNTANTANSTANAAKTAAANAQTAANNAAKTATNFVGVSGEGVVVGDMAESELGSNVLISPDELAFRIGQEVLARFAANFVQLGLATDEQASLRLGKGTGISSDAGATSANLDIWRELTDDMMSGSVNICLGSPNSSSASLSLVLRPQGANGSAIHMKADMLGVSIPGEGGVGDYYNMSDFRNLLRSRVGDAVNVSFGEVTAPNGNAWAQAPIIGTNCISSGGSFRVENGGVTVEDPGMYLIAVSGIAYSVVQGDLCHVGVGTSTQNIRVDAQECMVGNWGQIAKTEVVRITATRASFKPYYRCEQGGGSKLASCVLSIVRLSAE